MAKVKREVVVTLPPTARCPMCGREARKRVTDARCFYVCGKCGAKIEMVNPLEIMWHKVPAVHRTTLPKDPKDYVLPFGKHQGKTVGQVMQEDTHYFGWLCALPDLRSPLRDAVACLVRESMTDPEYYI